MAWTGVPSLRACRLVRVRGAHTHTDVCYATHQVYCTLMCAYWIAVCL